MVVVVAIQAVVIAVLLWRLYVASRSETPATKDVAPLGDWDVLTDKGTNTKLRQKRRQDGTWIVEFTYPPWESDGARKTLTFEAVDELPEGVDPKTTWVETSYCCGEYGINTYKGGVAVFTFPSRVYFGSR